MHPQLANEAENGYPAERGADDSVGARVEALAAWIQELDAQIQAVATATADKDTLKELRRVIEAQAKRDPKFEDRLTERVNVVADRLETLAKTISTTAGTTASKDGEIAGLRREVEERSARLEKIVSELRRTADPKALDELRRAMESASDRKAPRKGDDRRLDGLSGKVDTLAQRLDTLASTVATTAAGLAGREGEVVALRRKLEDDNARVEALVAELRTVLDPARVTELGQTVKAVSDEDKTARRDQSRRIDGVSAKVDSLVERLDSLARTVAATAAGDAGRETEINGLRATLDEETARVDSWLKELQKAIGEFSSQLAALDSEADRGRVEALETRLEGLGGKVDDVVGRFDSLASTVTQTGAEIAAKEESIAALRARLEQGNANVDSVVAELRQAIGELSSQLGALDGVADRESVEALERRLEGFGGKVDDVVGRFDSLASTVAQTGERIAAKEESIGALEARFDQASARVEALVSELQQALEDRPDPGALVSELEPRLDDLAQQLNALASEVAQVTATGSTRWEDMRAGASRLQEEMAGNAERLDALAQTVSTTATGLVAGEAELAGLRARIEQGNANVDSVVAELRQAIGELSSQLAVLDSEADRESVEALERRLEGFGGKVDDVLGRFDSLASTVAEAGAEIAAKEESIGALEARFDQASARVEALVSELQQALEDRPDPGALVSELEPRLDDLAQQLNALASEVAQVTATGSTRWEDMRAGASRLQEEMAGNAERLDALERVYAAGSAELARAAETAGEERTWVREQLGAFASALQELSARTASDEAGQHADLAARLEAAERQGAAVASEVAHTAAFWATQLDAIRARFDEVESTRGESPPPATEEGRYRADLRALELRLELAEAAASKSRDEVLAQLGRLAARIEARLDRVESPRGGAPDDPTTATGEVGQLLPLRGAEA